jgi:hypothetical protein
VGLPLAPPEEIGRIVALGASNLTRGLQTVVATSRAEWGPGVEVMAALGHGRSYGAPSRLAVRTLPGILASGLWKSLESRPPVAKRALVTDVGNDILYGFGAEQTLAWVAEALDRLRGFTRDIVVTDLPFASIRSLSRSKFLLLRSILVPSCRLSLAQVVEAAERVNAGLADLAAVHGATFFRLNPKWYGFDPIHIRPSLWRAAWQELLGSQASMGGSLPRLEGVRLYFTPPERQWLFGVERFSFQPSAAPPSRGRVWLY